jgi:hypothetical protein
MSRNIGTEDPNAWRGTSGAVHPVTRAECIKKVIDSGKLVQNPKYEEICGAPWMSPVPDANGRIDNAKSCIDQFEFPNIPCEYPVVWNSTLDAQEICGAMGKRVCMSYEWEAACAGSMDDRPNAGHFGYGARPTHNANREIVYAYDWQPEFKGKKAYELCSVYHPKDPEFTKEINDIGPSKLFSDIGESKGCNKDTEETMVATCGTNTWPLGFKHDCRSRYDVFELHGNLAEQIWLPNSQKDIATAEKLVGGVPERKGLWFVRPSARLHDCRVRQGNDHPPLPHRFFQEGFRCCKNTAN